MKHTPCERVKLLALEPVRLFYTLFTLSLESKCFIQLTLLVESVFVFFQESSVIEYNREILRRLPNPDVYESEKKSLCPKSRVCFFPSMYSKMRLLSIVQVLVSFCLPQLSEMTHLILWQTVLHNDSDKSNLLF